MFTAPDERERDRQTDRQTDRQRQRQRGREAETQRDRQELEKLEKLMDCRVRSVWTYLTASPCYITEREREGKGETETDRQRQRHRETDRLFQNRQKLGVL